MQTNEQSLKNDTRGAVLLVAVFFSAFLVGALWYIIGVGDAAIYRQYMQDGADAVAFGSAVYHARGMNIIALINLVMAAVLMVLVAFKIAQLLLIAANIASCLIGAFLDPVCDLTSAAEEPFEVWVNRVETVVDKILRVLYTTSNAVALGMPWVAEGKAVVVAGDYKSTVDGGMMASISLVPGMVMGEGNRYGLPVEDDDFSQLCKRAGQDVVKFVFLPFNFLGMGGLASGVEKFAGSMVGTLVSTFPGYFCGGITDAAGSLSSELKDAATGGSKDSIKTLCDKKKDSVSKSKDKSGFDYDKCLKSGGALDKLDGGSVTGKGKTSKKPYDAAVLGDDYYAVWGFDWGDLSSQSGAARGVDIAGWNGAHAGDANMFTKIGVAQGEFYYEPRAGGPTKWRGGFKSTLPGPLASDKGLQTEALWNMRWRARLRRVHLPTPSIGSFMADKLADKIKVPLIGKMLKWPVTKLGDLVDGEVKKILGPATEGFMVH